MMETAEVAPKGATEGEVIELRLTDIALRRQLQVRQRMDPKTIQLYAGFYRNGANFPPLAVAKLTKGFVLVDGWHRYHALQQIKRHAAACVVVAHDFKEAAWKAAEANLRHGLRLKRWERHNAFKAFVRAGKHLDENGVFLGYRKVADALAGLGGYTTMRNWMMKYFPDIYRAVGDTEENFRGTGGPQEAPAWASVSEEVEWHIRQGVALSLTLNDADQRAEVAKLLERAAAEVREGKAVEPLPEDY